MCTVSALDISSESKGTCLKLAAGRGAETEGGSQLFEAQKREVS